jgi:hypothetical protein
MSKPWTYAVGLLGGQAEQINSMNLQSWLRRSQCVMVDGLPDYLGPTGWLSFISRHKKCLCGAITQLRHINSRNGAKPNIDQNVAEGRDLFSGAFAESTLPFPILARAMRR